MADTFVPTTFVPDELLTSTKMNQLGTNQTNFHEGDGLSDGAIVTRHLNAGAVTPEKQTAVTYTATMPASEMVVTASDQIIGSQVLPTYATPHKFLILAYFEYTHEHSGNIRDYVGRIKNGAAVLREGSVTSENPTYVRSFTLNTVFTSSGGETINFTIARNIDSGGRVLTRSHYSIVDLGRA